MNNRTQDNSQPAVRRKRPRIGITMGDPAGIGPEVVLKAVAEEEVRGVCQPVIIGDAQLLAHNARTLDLQCGYEIVRRDERLPDQGDEPLIEPKMIDQTVQLLVDDASVLVGTAVKKITLLDELLTSRCPSPSFRGRQTAAGWPSAAA